MTKQPENVDEDCKRPAKQFQPRSLLLQVGGTAHTARNAKSPLFPADRAGHKRLQIVRRSGSSDWEGAEKRSSKLDERHRFLDSTKSSKDATGRNIYQLFKEQIRSALAGKFERQSVVL